MAEKNEKVDDKKKKIGFKFVGMTKIITIFAIFAVILGITGAGIFELKVQRVIGIEKNNPDYSPSAYYKSIYITQEGTLMAGLSVQDMWDHEELYRQYLPSVDALAYFLNAQIVTQYPYIETAEAEDLNGTIKFYRNDNFEPMKYVTYDTLNNYISSYNSGESSVLDTALSSFTLNSDGTISIAYLTENKYEVIAYDYNAAQDASGEIGASISGAAPYKVSRTESYLSLTNISYASYVKKYTLPFQLLWSFAVFNTEQGENFAHAVASMSYESKIDLIINDNKNVTIDTYNYTYDIEQQHRTKSSSVQASISRYYEDRDEPSRYDYSTSTSTEYLSDAAIISQYTGNTATIYRESHTTNNPSLMVRSIRSWIANYSNYGIFSTSETSSDRTSDIAQPESPTQWTYKETRTSSWNVSNCPIPGLKDWAMNAIQSRRAQDEAQEDITRAEVGNITIRSIEDIYQRYNNIHVSFNERIIQSTYSADSVTSPSFNKDLSRLLNVGVFSPLKKAVLRSYTFSNGYFKRMIKGNEDTANMIDLISYWLNDATGTDDYGKDLDWDSIWDDIEDDYEIINPNSLSLIELATKYVNANEGCTKVSSDGTKYMIQDDGAGNLAVGHGIDIYNGGYASLFKSKGYQIKEGEWVDKDFVEELEKQEVQDAYEAILKETSSLNLKDYQIIALISRYYNCGAKGWKTSRNGKTFIQAYQAYWSEEKTENYFGKRSDSNIYSETFYTSYMYKPNTSKGNYMKGLENRRKSEWLAFTTGYFDKLGIQWTEEKYGSTGSGDIVSNAKKVHDYIKENQYAYSCKHNVKNGYVNSCTCNGASNFGLSLNASNHNKWYNIRCIDCSAYVSLVLYESGIDIGRQHSGFFYNGEYNSNYTQYKWQKITDWNDLQPGDILVKSGHVGIYYGNGYTLEAGSTGAIRKDKNHGNISSVRNAYSFAVRVTK